MSEKEKSPLLENGEIPENTENAEAPSKPKFMPGERLRALLAGRRLRQGGISAALTVAFVAALVLLNLVVTALSERYQLHLDLTAEQVFVLTQESKDYLNSLDREVAVYVLTPEQSLTAGGDPYLIQANEVIKQYAVQSERVTVEYVDLTRNPGFKNSYPQYQLNDQTILVESGDRVTTLTLSDLFNIEMDAYYGQYMEWIASSKAEQAMTGAIMNVSMENRVVVSIISGFGEVETAGLSELLETNRYEVQTQNILTGEIDPATNVAVICAPARDYTEEALRKLDAFLQNEGNLGKTLIYLAGAMQPPTPNLNAFLEEWGISVDDGIVYQTDNNMLIMTGNPMWSVVDYNEEIYSEKALAQKLIVVMPEARPLTRLFEEKGSRSVSVSLSFGEGACVMPLDGAQGWTPAQSQRSGSIPAMLVSEESAYLGDERVASTVVALASDLMVESSLLAVPSLGNSEYILGALGVLTGHKEGIIIAPKTVGVSFLPITALQANVLSVIFVIVLPLAVVVTGGVVFFRRRNL